MDLDLPNQEFIIQMIEKSSWFVVQTGGKKENIKKKRKTTHWLFNIESNRNYCSLKKGLLIVFVHELDRKLRWS